MFLFIARIRLQYIGWPDGRLTGLGGRIGPGDTFFIFIEHRFLRKIWATAFPNPLFHKFGRRHMVCDGNIVRMGWVEIQYAAILLARVK